MKRSDLRAMIREEIVRANSLITLNEMSERDLLSNEHFGMDYEDLTPKQKKVIDSEIKNLYESYGMPSHEDILSMRRKYEKYFPVGSALIDNRENLFKLLRKKFGNDIYALDRDVGLHAYAVNYSPTTTIHIAINGKIRGIVIKFLQEELNIRCKVSQGSRLKPFNKRAYTLHCDGETIMLM